MKRIFGAVACALAVAACGSSQHAVVTRTQTVASNPRTVTVTSPAPAVATATKTVTATVTHTATTAQTAASTQPSTSPTSSNLTLAEQNAVGAAKDYLATQGFSQAGLIQQLSSADGSGFSVHDATVAVDRLDANWDVEAVRSAKDYLSTESFSCNGMIRQLSSSYGSGYTLAQATYAAQKVGLC